MGQAKSGDVSSETPESDMGATATNAYISPLADFLLLFAVTAVGAVSLVLLL